MTDQLISLFHGILIPEKDVESFKASIAKNLTAEDYLNHIDEEYHNSFDIEDPFYDVNEESEVFSSFANKYYPLLQLEEILDWEGTLEGFAVYVKNSINYLEETSELILYVPTQTEIESLLSFKNKYAPKASLKNYQLVNYQVDW